MIPAGTTYDPNEVLVFFHNTGIPPCEFEWEFHSLRKWRFDLAWPARKIAVEVHGGLYVGGRHTTPRGFLNDMEKENAATVAGWSILKTTPRGIISFSTSSMLLELIKNKPHVL